MMDYEIFKDVVTEKFLSYMPKDYQGMEVKVASVEKVNRKLDGLSLLLPDSERMISPTIYINDMMLGSKAQLPNIENLIFYSK